MGRPRSSKPRVQRRYEAAAPYHHRHRLMGAHLSDELRSKYGTRSLPVRKGDTVLVVRGDHIGREGEVIGVDTKRRRIFIKDLTRRKVDGTEIPVPIHPSKVIITKLKLDDQVRQKILDRKGGR